MAPVAREKNLRHMLGACLLISFCGGSTLYGFKDIVHTSLGTSLDTSLQFYAVALGCVCFGILLPQFAIGIFNWFSSSGEYWFTGEHQISAHFWFAGGRAETRWVASLFSGCLLLFSILSIVSSLYYDRLFLFFKEIHGGFIIGPILHRGIDFLLLITFLGPSWIIGGLILALFYRLAISVDQSTRSIYQLEGRLPGWLFVPFILGMLLWHYIFPLGGNGYYLILTHQIFILIVVLYLFYQMPERLTYQKQLIYKATPVELDEVQSQQMFVLGKVFYCATIVGGLAIIVIHLFNLLAIDHMLLKITALFFTICIAAGTFGGMKFVRGGDALLKQAELLLYLFWPLNCLIFIVLYYFAWQAKFNYHWPSWAVVLIEFVLIAVVGVLMLLLGVWVRFGKRFTQQVLVSKALGWAWWLVLSSSGVLIGGYFFGQIMLTRGGSLQALVAMVFSGVVGGIIVNVVHRELPLRFVLYSNTAGALLFVTNCIIFMNMNQLWLAAPYENIHHRLIETYGTGWVANYDQTGIYIKPYVSNGQLNELGDIVTSSLSFHDLFYGNQINDPPRIASWSTRFSYSCKKNSYQQNEYLLSAYTPYAMINKVCQSASSNLEVPITLTSLHPSWWESVVQSKYDGIDARLHATSIDQKNNDQYIKTILHFHTQLSLNGMLLVTGSDDVIQSSYGEALLLRLKMQYLKTEKIAYSIVNGDGNMQPFRTIACFKSEKPIGFNVSFIKTIKHHNDEILKQLMVQSPVTDWVEAN